MLKEFITSMWRPDKHKKRLQSTSTLNCLALTRMLIFSSSLLFTATCRGHSRTAEGCRVVAQSMEIPGSAVLCNELYDLEQLSLKASEVPERILSPEI